MLNCSIVFQRKVETKDFPGKEKKHQRFLCDTQGNNAKRILKITKAAFERKKRIL